MRTFEFKDGKSNKFWNIALKGKSFTVTFGKIGTSGQTQEKKFPSAAAAQAAHDKLVAERLGKGYVEKPGLMDALRQTLGSLGPNARLEDILPHIKVEFGTATPAPVAAGRKFEFKDGKSSKFWNIHLQGKSFTVTFGKIGSAGQSQVKKFRTEAAARVACDRLVAEKLRKGYLEIGAALDQRTTEKPGKGGAAAVMSPIASAGKALENAILANPDDLGARAAYADWLIEQGDPRGEFMQLQLALEDESLSTPERKELQKREKALLKQHQAEWLGRLGPILTPNPTVNHPEDFREVPNYQYRFVRGFLDTLHITCLTVSLSQALRDGPESRLLRELAIDGFTYEERETDEESILAPLLKIRCWDSLRSLRLGSEIDMEVCLTSRYGTQHHASLQYCTPLFERMPRLEELHLLGKDLDVDRLFASRKLQHLRVLRIYHLGTRRAGGRADNRGEYAYPLATLAKNVSFQNLTHLLFHPHHEEFYYDPKDPDRKGCFLPLTQVRAILRSKHLKQLTHLQLRLSTMGDEGCKEIVASGILKQLKVLDLRHGCISDAGANILAASGDLKHLEHLDLCRNGLTAKGIKALKATGVSLTASHQQTPEQLQEQDYLRDGDSE
jgi:uncharacterized protein (TIGR02996 family)